MKFNISKKDYLPHIIAIVIFFALSIAYFPQVFQGKNLNQHDMMTYRGMSKEINDFNKKTGEYSYWTNSMFGGMPTYLIQNYTPKNYTKHIDMTLKLWDKLKPISYIFMYCLGFYIMLLLFGFNPWQSIVGSLAFGLSSYFLIIIEAGHITKIITLGYMPPIVGGIYAAYKGKRLIGTVVMSIFLSIQIFNNHLQITYYQFLLILPLVIILFINAIRNKLLPDFIKTSIYLLVGMILAIGANSQSLLTTYEYGKESIRGKSELTANKDNQTTGLDKDYATRWSYGKIETFNLLIPNLMGGASVGELPENSEVYDRLIGGGYTKKQAAQTIKRMPTYWGDQPGTSGPVYIGALVIFLFVLGIFLVKGEMRTWLLIATALSIMLAWGHNFMFLTDLFLDYFPGYNKFRTVSMILVIAQLSIPLLGFLGLKNIIEKKVSKEEVIKAIKKTTIILGGIILLFLLNPGLLTFVSEYDASQLGDFLSDAMAIDRESMMRKDAIRSLVFVLIGAATIWMYVKEKLKLNYLFIILGLAIVVDLWGVNKRFLNDDDFIKNKKIENAYTPSKADEFILQDKNLSYRVLNLNNPFNDASTSYFHKSVGGYHGAKMRRYQELIENGISPELAKFIGTLQSAPSQEVIENAFKSSSILNMLNTKYVIYNPANAPLPNIYNLGNAWFVDNVEVVDNADEEIKAIQNFNSATTAIVDERFKDQLFDFKKDTNAYMQLTEYKPNKLVYETAAKTDQLAVMSEIYYDKGWEAYIDNEKVEHFRVNYVLRAMKVPAGKHTIMFKFNPKAPRIGGVISMISSLILLGLLAFIAYKQLFKKEEA